MSKGIEALRDVTELSRQPGNTNGPYMRGLANGLILALAIMDDEEPKYLSCPNTELPDINDVSKDDWLDIYQDLVGKIIGVLPSVGSLPRYPKIKELPGTFPVIQKINTVAQEKRLAILKALTAPNPRQLAEIKELEDGT